MPFKVSIQSGNERVLALNFFKIITKFRQVEPKTSPCFGVNAVAQSCGVIRVGDSVKVLSVLERETFES